MAVAVRETNRNNIIFYYVSSVGSIIVSIFVVIMLTHILFRYIGIFHRSSKQDSLKRNKTPYLLFVGVCLGTLLICISDGFVRGNIFTSIPTSEFTFTQCVIGWYGNYLLIFCCQLFMYSLFIYRIQVVFKDTTYSYSSKIFTCLYIVLFIGFFIMAILVTAAYSTIEYRLWSFKGTNIFYCDSNEGTSNSFLITIVIVTFMLLQTGFNFTLLYMFTKKLYALQIDMVHQYMSENANSNIEEYNSKDDFEVGGASPKSVSSITSDNISDFKIKKQRTITIDHAVNESKKGNSSTKMVLNLHKIIKKHTILVYISIISFILWLISAYITAWMYLEINWIIFINVVCIWLMFAESKKYWKFMVNYSCCYVCYCRRQKDISAKTCCLFC